VWSFERERLRAARGDKLVPAEIVGCFGYSVALQVITRGGQAERNASHGTCHHVQWKRIVAYQTKREIVAFFSEVHIQLGKRDIEDHLRPATPVFGKVLGQPQARDAPIAERDTQDAGRRRAQRLKFQLRCCRSSRMLLQRSK